MSTGASANSPASANLTAHDLVGCQIALWCPILDRWLRVTDEGGANSPARGHWKDRWTWERFEVVDVGNGLIALLNSATNRWLRLTDKGDANSPARGDFQLTWEWERFAVVDVGRGHFGLQNLATGRWLRLTDQGDATSPAHGDWKETWTWERFAVKVLRGKQGLDLKDIIDSRARRAYTMALNPVCSLAVLMGYAALASESDGKCVRLIVEAARDRYRMARLHRDLPLDSRVQSGIDKMVKYQDEAKSQATANNVGQAIGYSVGFAGGVVALAASGPIGWGVAAGMGISGGVTTITTGVVTTALRDNVVRQADEYFQGEYGDLVGALLDANQSFEAVVQSLGMTLKHQFVQLENMLLMMVASESILAARHSSQLPIDEVEVFLHACIRWGVQGDDLKKQLKADIPQVQLIGGADVASYVAQVVKASGTGARGTCQILKCVSQVQTQARIAQAVSTQAAAVKAVKGAKDTIETGRQLMKANAATLATYSQVGGRMGDASKVAQGAKMMEEGAVALKEAKAVIKQTNKLKCAPEYAKMGSFTKALTIGGLVIDGVMLAWCVADLVKGSPYPQEEAMNSMVRDLKQSKAAFKIVGALCDDFLGKVEELGH